MEISIDRLLDSGQDFILPENSMGVPAGMYMIKRVSVLHGGQWEDSYFTSPMIHCEKLNDEGIMDDGEEYYILANALKGLKLTDLSDFFQQKRSLENAKSAVQFNLREQYYDLQPGVYQIVRTNKISSFSAPSQVIECHLIEPNGFPGEAQYFVFLHELLGNSNVEFVNDHGQVVPKEDMEALNRV